MDFLKAEIARKKKQIEDTQVIVSDEARFCLYFEKYTTHLAQINYNKTMEGS